MNVKPVKGKLIAKLIHESKKSPGGIITDLKPNGTFSNFAEVLAVGEEVVEVKAGDQIVIPRSCGVDVTIDGDHYLSLLECEILGVLTEKFEVAEKLPADLNQTLNS